MDHNFIVCTCNEITIYSFSSPRCHVQKHTNPAAWNLKQILGKGDECAIKKKGVAKSRHSQSPHKKFQRELNT